MASVKKEYIVDLKGKQHPTWVGILDAAHEAGLRCLESKVVQFPSEANQWTAVCEAVATFAGPDGRDRVFSDIGDANAGNTNRMIAAHIIRMSSTRAKGRALRDALNIGDALAEELAEEAEHRPAPRPKAEPIRGSTQERASSTEGREPPGEWTLGVCTCKSPGCGQLLTQDEIRGCQKYKWPPLCTQHGREHIKALNAQRPS